MRRDQVFKVCANHVVTKTLGIKPLNISNNALDYAGEFLALNANFFSFLDFSKIPKKHKTTYKLC